MPTPKPKTGAQRHDDLPQHSWDCRSWPPAVWPNDAKRARWVLRAYRSELVAAGALSRGGKALVILGRGYARWLARRAGEVTEFESNNPSMRRDPRQPVEGA